MGSPPWGAVPDSSQLRTAFFSCALASWVIFSSSRADWPQPSQVNTIGALDASSTQHFLLLQQFSRCGFCSCIPQRGIHFLTQTLSFSVSVWQSLHLVPSSCSFSRGFLHFAHQTASSIVARSQAGPFFAASW